MAENYTVIAQLEVRADSEAHAVDRVADALRPGFKGSGIAPVGSFRVYKGAPNLLDKLPDPNQTGASNGGE